MNRHTWPRRTVPLLLAGALVVLGAVAAVVPAAVAGTSPCQGAGFDIGIDRTDDTATPGTTASTGVQLITSGVFTCPVALTVGGLPDGVTATPSSATLHAGQGRLQIVFTTMPSSPLGRFPILITGATASRTSKATFQLIIATVDEAPPRGSSTKFAMLARTTAGSAVIGVSGVDSVGPAIILERDPDFHDVVRFSSASDLPPGVTAQLGAGATFTPSTTSPPGTFRITLTAADVPEHGPAHSVTLHFWLTIAAAPGFTLSLDRTEDQVVRGGATTTVLRQSTLEGRSDQADVSVGTLPAGVTASFSSPTVSSTAPATLTLQVSTTAETGTFLIPVTATSFTTGLPETVTFVLSVFAAPDYIVRFEPGSGDVSPGGTTSTTLHLKPVGAFTGTVFIALQKPTPVGVSVSFSGGGLTADNEVTMTVTAAPDAPTGSFFITVFGGLTVGATTKPYTYVIRVGPPSA